MQYIFGILEAHWLIQYGFCWWCLKSYLKLPQPSMVIFDAILLSRMIFFKRNVAHPKSAAMPLAFWLKIMTHQRFSKRYYIHLCTLRCYKVVSRQCWKSEKNSFLSSKFCKIQLFKLWRPVTNRNLWYLFGKPRWPREWQHVYDTQL